MFEFNNTHIFTGYIKQFLHAFHLPKYRVYTVDFYRYLAIYGKESPEVLPTIKAGSKTSPNIDTVYINYIKDGHIQRYIDNKWVATNWSYYYNKKELNQTKNLIIKNNVYDSYTHEYLGDFLRFQRDYNNIDLMPLYNCFSNNLCHILNFDEAIPGFNISYETESYLIYMLPVKLFKKYTIAMSSDLPIEICCGFYTNRQDDRSKHKKFPKFTYKKYGQMIFSQPVVYDYLTAENLQNIIDSDTSPKFNSLSELAQYESELKMFIKIPKAVKTSIVILEGDYTNFNQGVLLNKSWVWNKALKCVELDMSSKYSSRFNKFVVNYATKNYAIFGDDDSSDDDPDDIDTYTTNEVIETTLPTLEQRNFIPYTFLQLLTVNDGINHPFADRLVEYLTYNAITPVETLEDNVVRVQKTMEINGFNFDTEGAWSENMKYIIYDYMHNQAININTLYGIKNSQLVIQDGLGYVDKDVEKYYTGWTTEIVLDEKGNKKQATDKDGKPLYLSKNKILRDTNESQNSILRDSYIKILRDSTDDETEPLWETTKVPVSTISNIDIYNELYLDDKKEK